MSDYVVKTAGLIQASEELKRVSDKAQNIADEARSVINQTRSSISSKLVQSGKSAVIHASISLCSSDMSKLSQVLEKASDTYNAYEEKVQAKERSFNVVTGAVAAAIAGAVNIQMANNKGGSNSSVLEDAVVSGEATSNGHFLGFDTSGKASGSALGYSVDTKRSATWDSKKGEIGASIDTGADVYAAKGSLEGSIGGLKGLLEGSALTAGISGGAGISLFKNNKLNPSIEADLKLKGSVLEGKAGVQIGSDETNVHVESDGSVLGAEVSADVGIGAVEVKDKETGKVSTQYGVEASVGAEAYLAEGEVSGGFTIFGIDIDASISGKAGGVGVEAGGSVTTGGISGKIGAGLGLGAGVEISIDWSDFKMPEIEWPFW